MRPQTDKHLEADEGDSLAQLGTTIPTIEQQPSAETRYKAEPVARHIRSVQKMKGVGC